MLVILVVAIVSDCLLMMSWALGTMVMVVAVTITSLTVVVIGLVMVIVVVVVNPGRVVCW